MFEGSLLLGATLCFFAWWLQSIEKQGWPNETFVTDLDKEYRASRLDSRRKIHYLIAGCGVLILLAAFSGPEFLVAWALCWTLVMLGLMVVIFLAAVDVFRTHRYHRRKLPEIREQAFKSEDS
ncbi:MAG: hypothetical protein ACON5D_00540 [Rubripirellula sp.]